MIINNVQNTLILKQEHDKTLKSTHSQNYKTPLLKKTTQTSAKDNYANPKTKMEVQAHDNNECLVQQQGTEYMKINKENHIAQKCKS